MINALYGTNVYAFMRIASRVTNIMAHVEIPSAGPESVERLANPPEVVGKKKYRHYCFASKFAHFFVNAERYPIMDSYAKQMLKLHLGPSRFILNPEHPYLAFCANYELLRSKAGFTGSNREMDHYLWLAGEYLAWRKNRKSWINIQIRALFENHTAEVAAELDALVPSILSRAFKGEL